MAKVWGGGGSVCGWDGVGVDRISGMIRVLGWCVGMCCII